MYPGTLQTPWVFTRNGWSRAERDWRARTSRAVVTAFELAMNFSAIRGPDGASASHTSANPPRPRTRRSRYPGDGSAPAATLNAPGVDDWIRGKKVNTVSPSWLAGDSAGPVVRPGRRRRPK